MKEIEELLGEESWDDAIEKCQKVIKDLNTLINLLLKGDTRIEDILKARQMIMCQVTKNPIGAKGARLTQEVSLPGRFVVLIPNSKTYGISKRLPDETRKRLRNILDRVKPEQHGLIVRTAAEHATEACLLYTSDAADE